MRPRCGIRNRRHEAPRGRRCRGSAAYGRSRGRPCADRRGRGHRCWLGRKVAAAMRFSPQQDGALCAAARWLRAPSAQIFRLFGYAGTGKTTFAKHLAEHVDGRVLFAAYTGKAAHVMHAKGCKDAGTLHGLIYICSETEDGPQFELTGQSPLAEGKLLIVD